MKRLIIACYIMLGIGTAAISTADASSFNQAPSLSISLFRFSDDDGKTGNPEINPIGRRAHRLPLTGEISISGIFIPGVDNTDIISFEIYDLSGICMGAYNDEMDFINALFSLSGEYEIRFATEDYTFIGGIEI